jgi:prevent-host-death family protein
MPKTISASEAKNSLGAVIEWAVENQDEVIVESRGKPKAVIMPFDDYEEYQQLREQARRRAVLARLEKLAEKTGARNQDLTAEAAEALADQFTREVINDMIAEGKVQYDPS